jgi:hypothetical protein
MYIALGRVGSGPFYSGLPYHNKRLYFEVTGVKIIMSTESNISFCSPRPSSGRDPNTPVLVVSAKPLDCPPNHVLIKVERFGFSANNITYQALGEHPHFR